MQDGLALDGLFDRAHAIANPRGLLEFEPRRMLFHQIAHLAQQFEIFSFEQHLRRVQMAAVLVAIDRQAARPEASLDLIFEARPRAIAKDRVGAGAQRKNLADDVDSLAQSVGRSERAEVVTAVLYDLARDGDSRPRMIGDLRAQVRFVVLEPDVVPGLVLLDQVVLENQRFLLARGDDGVEVAHPLHQEAHLVAAVAALAEICAHARAQRLRLADVEHLARAIAQYVDARVGRGSGQLLIDGAGFVFEHQRLGIAGLRRRFLRILDQRAVLRPRRLVVFIFGSHRRYYYIIAIIAPFETGFAASAGQVKENFIP